MISIQNVGQSFKDGGFLKRTMTPDLLLTKHICFALAAWK